MKTYFINNSSDHFLYADIIYPSHSKIEVTEKLALELRNNRVFKKNMMNGLFFILIEKIDVDDEEVDKKSRKKRKTRKYL